MGIEMAKNNTQKRTGPGRPPVENGRTKTKCFRLGNRTEKELEAVMEYYGKKQGKEKLSIGMTIEMLVREKFEDIKGRQDYDNL